MIKNKYDKYKNKYLRLKNLESYLNGGSGQRLIYNTGGSYNSNNKDYDVYISNCINLHEDNISDKLGDNIWDKLRNKYKTREIGPLQKYDSFALRYMFSLLLYSYFDNEESFFILNNNAVLNYIYKIEYFYFKENIMFLFIKDYILKLDIYPKLYEYVKKDLLFLNTYNDLLNIIYPLINYHKRTKEIFKKYELISYSESSIQITLNTKANSYPYITENIETSLDNKELFEKNKNIILENLKYNTNYKKKEIIPLKIFSKLFIIKTTHSFRLNSHNKDLKRDKYEKLFIFLNKIIIYIFEKLYNNNLENVKYINLLIKFFKKPYLYPFEFSTPFQYKDKNRIDKEETEAFLKDSNLDLILNNCTGQKENDNIDISEEIIKDDIKYKKLLTYLKEKNNLRIYDYTKDINHTNENLIFTQFTQLEHYNFSLKLKKNVTNFDFNNFEDDYYEILDNNIRKCIYYFLFNTYKILLLGYNNFSDKQKNLNCNEIDNYLPNDIKNELCTTLENVSEKKVKSFSIGYKNNPEAYNIKFDPFISTDVEYFTLSDFIYDRVIHFHILKCLIIYLIIEVCEKHESNKYHTIFDDIFNYKIMNDFYTGILDFFLNDTSSPDNFCIDTFTKSMKNIIEELINNSKKEINTLHFITDNTFTNIGYFNYKYYTHNKYKKVNIDALLENIFYNADSSILIFDIQATVINDTLRCGAYYEKYNKYITILRRNIELCTYNIESEKSDLMSIIYKMYNNNSNDDLYIFTLIKDIKMIIINNIITNINKIYSTNINKMVNVYISEYCNFINTNLIVSKENKKNIAELIDFFQKNSINKSNLQSILNKINIKNTYLYLLIKYINLEENDKIIVLSTKYDIYNLNFMNDEEKKLLEYYIKLFKLIIDCKKEKMNINYKVKYVYAISTVEG